MQDTNKSARQSGAWRLAGAVIASLALAASAGSAQAAKYIFSFTDGSANVLAEGFLFTADVTNVLGGYDVFDATGTIDGQAIDELVDNPNPPNDASVVTPTVPGYIYIYNNVLYPDAVPAVNVSGLLFRVGTRLYNIYAPPVDTIVYDVGGEFVSRSGTFVATAVVPEPASWALMITGFGLSGSLLRNRRRAGLKVNA